VCALLVITATCVTGIGVIRNVAPTEGSVAGGSSVVISGSGLFTATVASSLSVVIGSQWPCTVNILQSTPSLVVCTTTGSFTAVRNAAVVVSTTLGTASCQGNCSFSYLQGECPFAR
jgi:hypothetical protein